MNFDELEGISKSLLTSTAIIPRKKKVEQDLLSFQTEDQNSFFRNLGKSLILNFESQKYIYEPSSC
jgi:hypothetical protein